MFGVHRVWIFTPIDKLAILVTLLDAQCRALGVAKWADLVVNQVFSQVIQSMLFWIYGSEAEDKMLREKWKLIGAIINHTGHFLSECRPIATARTVAICRKIVEFEFTQLQHSHN